MYKQNKAGSDSSHPSGSKMSQEALAYLNSLKETSKAIHSVSKGETSNAKTIREESVPTVSKKSISAKWERNEFDQKPHRRASISSVVSDIWEHKGKLSKDTPLSEMNILEADELSEIFSSPNFTISEASESVEQSSAELKNSTVASVDKRKPGLKRPRQQQNAISQANPAIARKPSGKKKSVAEEIATVDELASGHPEPGSIDRKSSMGLSASQSRAIQKSIEKSIFGTSARPNNMISDTRRKMKSQNIPPRNDIQSANPNLDKQTQLDKYNSIMKRSPFRKVSTVVSGSSTPSDISSIASVAEEIMEPEENTAHYSTHSFEEITSAETFSSSTASKSKSVQRSSNDFSNEVKSVVFSSGSSTIFESERSTSRSSTSSVPKHEDKSKQLNEKLKNVQQKENIFSDSDSTETSSSMTASLENNELSKKMMKRRRGDSHFSEAKNNHHNSTDNKERKRSFGETNITKMNPKEELLSKVSDSEISQSRGQCLRSNVHSSRSLSERRNSNYKEMKRSDISDSEYNGTSSFTHSQMYDQNSSDVKQSQHSKLRYADLLVDFEKLLKKYADNSKRTELRKKNRLSNAAVQTIDLEAESRLSPTFMPLLLKDIEESMKMNDEREAVSSVIQIHVELIRKQARREKRVLEEWDAAITDLEERCQMVNFDQLKLLLQGKEYSVPFEKIYY